MKEREMNKGEKIKFTVDEFYATMRIILYEAKYWWDRECTYDEHMRLLHKYNLNISEQTDDNIIKMYVDEHPEKFSSIEQTPKID